MKTGIYPNLSREDYDAIPAVNASLLKCADRSMAHAKAYIDGHRKTSEALAFGAAYHAYVLERERFDREYVTIPKVNRTTKAGKEAWAAAVQQAGDESRVVWAEDVATFEAMRVALHSESRRRALCTCPGEYEVSVVWDRDGTLCKARIDKLCTDYDTALDLKKAEDAREHSFVGAVVRYGYALQAAFYMDGLAAVTGRPHGFCFLPQEDEPPYASQMFEVQWEDPLHLKYRGEIDRLINTIGQCKQMNKWPGYGDSVISIAQYAADTGKKWLIEQGA